MSRLLASLVLCAALLLPVQGWTAQTQLGPTETFTDTDGTVLPTYSANWYHTNCGENIWSQPEIRSNGVGADGSGGGTSCNGSQTWTNNQWAELTLDGTNAPDGVFGKLFVLLRVQAAADFSAYACGIDPSSIDSKYRIYRYDANSPTTLVASTQNAALSDVLNCQVDGTSITMLVNGSPPTGCASSCVYDTAGDGTKYASGNVGLAVRNGSQVILGDNWKAGSVDAATTIDFYGRRRGW